MGNIVYSSEFGVPENEQGFGLNIEDGGQAVIVHAGKTGDDHCFFVRLQSWDALGVRPRATREKPNPPLPEGSHPLMQSLFGKRVRVTVEVLDK
jgi:hypothetical protein